MLFIFDLDGTLVDSLEDLADAVNYGLRKMGCPEHETEKYKKMVGNGAQKLCYRALPDDRKDETEELLRLFSEYYDKHFLDKTKLYDGISELVGEITAAGHAVAVATNKPQDVARKIIAKLLPEITVVLGGCDERPKKPAPDIINEIVGKFPGAADCVVMIGDSNVDIRTAKNAAVHSVGCLWGFRSREELEDEGAEFIAEKPQQIAEKLRIMN